MKASYDAETDTLTLVFRDVAESDEERPGIILDFDEAGEMVSLEILDASRRATGREP